MSTAKTNNRQAGANNANSTRASSAGPAQRALGWLRGTGATGSTGANGAKAQRSSTSRFLVGSVAFILIAEVLTYLIALANAQWKLGLNTAVVSGGPTWLTWYFLINVVIIVGVWVTMQRLGFFPRDRFAARNGTTTTTRGASSGSGNGHKTAPANQIPGIGKPRTRAARRHALTTTAAVTTSAPSARRVAAESRASTPAPDPESSEHDEVYDRVKAAQRQRRRREARR